MSNPTNTIHILLRMAKSSDLGLHAAVWAAAQLRCPFWRDVRVTDPEATLEFLQVIGYECANPRYRVKED